MGEGTKSQSNQIIQTKSSNGRLFLLEVLKIIEFHEDEYLQSYVSDEILLAVLAISGIEEKDKLLIKDEKCYNIGGASPARRKA